MKLLEGRPDRRKACRVTLYPRGLSTILKKAFLQRRKPMFDLRWHYSGGSYSIGDDDEWKYLEAREKKQ